MCLYSIPFLDLPSLISHNIYYLNNHKNNEISYRNTDDMTSIIIQDSVNLSTTEEVYDKFGRLCKTVVDGNEIASFVYNDTNCGAERSIMNGTEWIHVGELFSNK